MYQIALCDDDLNFHILFGDMLLKSFSQRNIEYTLTLYDNVDSLLGSIDKGAFFDLLFLDILISEDNGIDLARLIRKRKFKTDIIFVTSSVEFAIDGYDIEPLHYLVKPLNKDKLEVAIDRFINRKLPQKILLKTSSGTLSLQTSDIVYFESYGHNMVVHLQNKTTVEISIPLKKLEDDLAPLIFFRTHKSFLVNLQYIEKIVRYTVSLSTGETVPIVKERYNSTAMHTFIRFFSFKFA